MWQKYSQKSLIDDIASTHEIRRNPEKVHAELKQMESGAENADSRVLREYAEGAIGKDDKRMRDYYIKQY